MERLLFRGLGYVTAQHKILQPYLEVADNKQHIASLKEPIELCIVLRIEELRTSYKQAHIYI